MRSKQSGTAFIRLCADGTEVFFVLEANMAIDNVKKNNAGKKAGKNGKENVKAVVNKATGYIKKVKNGAIYVTKAVKEDVAAVKDRDPAARSTAEVVLLYSGVHALAAYRIAHGLYNKEHYFAARAISQAAKVFTGIEIHPGAKIGKGLVIDHGTGVVIGETAEIGDNCTIYQGVTLGGTGKDVGKRHPTLGNNVMVGAGAKILGPLHVGDNSKVAANAVVLKEIPENCTAVGVPAKVVRREGVRVESDLDQIHIPDPVAQEIKRLENMISKLEKELENKKDKKK